MIGEIGAQVRSLRSFAFETTLSGLRYSRRIPEWRAMGYGVKLVFLYLCDVEIALARVAARVQQGGHAVPARTVRRRYRLGWQNLKTYRHIVDVWAVYDNSGDSPVLLEEGEGP